MAVVIFCCVPAYVNGGAVCEYVLIQGSISFNNQVVSKIVESTCRVFALTLAPQNVNSSRWGRQGSYRLWNSRKKLWSFEKEIPYMEKTNTMEFEQNVRTDGKTMEFSFWWKKSACFLLKNGGKIRSDFEIWS